MSGQNLPVAGGVFWSSEMLFLGVKVVFLNISSEFEGCETIFA